MDTDPDVVAGRADSLAIRHRRRTLTIFVGTSIAVFAMGLFIDVLTDTHDQYWVLFVAPSMIAFIVGVVALLLSLWSYVARRLGGLGP